jgi:hypothetical protein
MYRSNNLDGLAIAYDKKEFTEVKILEVKSRSMVCLELM